MKRHHGYLLASFPVLLCLCLFIAFSDAADYEGVKVNIIGKSSTASDGKKLNYLKTESPEVTALTVEIPAGGETGWHLHPVPVYAYMLAGSIAIEMANGEKHVFNEGDAIFEVMNTPHNGRNTGELPARLIVFYTGEQDRPNTVKVKVSEDPLRREAP